VERSVLRCHCVIRIFEAKSSRVAVCGRERDDRRSVRDVADADTKYKILMSVTKHDGELYR